MNSEYLDVRFPGWEVVRKLGQGSFGGVHEIQRTLSDGRIEKAALKKVVSVKHPEMYDFNRKALEMGRTFE